jgi:hypothetical protein
MGGPSQGVDKQLHIQITETWWKGKSLILEGNCKYLLKEVHGRILKSFDRIFLRAVTILYSIAFILRKSTAKT